MRSTIKIGGLLLLCLLVSGFAFAQEGGPGKELYDKYCSQCHGYDGDGQGYATLRVKPQPRDFTSGKYKFRTTPNGMQPTDADIVRSIKLGLPYTSMPAFKNLSDGEIDSIVEYIKSFSDNFQDESKLAVSIDIPEPPAITPESIERGAQGYIDQGCGACHGHQGRGDGMSAPTMKDDWGYHLRPADMTQRWTFRGGPTRTDIFRTFSTGLNGTPMPSYFDSVAVEDRWDLVNYIYSLGEGDDPGYDTLLQVPYLEDEIDIDLGAELFANAPVARFALVGQIIEPGRNFYPSATSVQIQAVYNRKEIAFLLRWNDMRAEADGSNSPMLEVPVWDEDLPGGGADAEEVELDVWGEPIEAEEDPWGGEAEDEGDFWGEDDGGDSDDGAGGEFSDAAALQFPSKLPTGIRKPYFIFGDAQGSVDLWFLDLARASVVQQYLGRGSSALEVSSADEFEVSSVYIAGEWQLIYKRELKSASNISFEPDQYVPISFSVWDGFNRERGNKRALSSWFYLYVEPTEHPSPVVPMIRAGVITLVVVTGLIFWIRRRFAPGVASESHSSGGGVPQGGLAK